jgi:SSS family solute:Na+ symporter
MDNLLPFGPGAWVFMATYLASMLVVGWFGYRARQENSLADFYVAGKGFGTYIIIMTLFATQYSGNTFYGFSGNTYRIGYAWIMSLHFMTAIIVCYLLFAPQLQKLARQNNYVTPPDYIQDRFGSRAITVIAAIVMILALSNYLLAQIMAMGRAMEGLASARPDDAYRYGVIVLAAIMVIYGTLGGLRAVAWTDSIQGAIMLVGFVLIFFMIFEQYGSLADATQKVFAADAANGTRKALPPDGARIREWFSYIFIVGFGAALYPQAIQRIYAARSPRVLRHSFAVMAFMPLPTQIMAMVIGIMALAYIPGLTGAGADQVFSLVLADIQKGSAFGYALVVVLMTAIVAAMMSTADSALLSISSMVTKDIYGRLLRPNASEAELTRVGKICSWILIVVLVSLAIALKEKTSLVRLLDRKFDLLIQMVPAFILGIRWRGLQSGPVLLGLIVGIVVAMTLAFGGLPFVVRGKVFGIHPGIYGLALNLSIATLGSLWLQRRSHVAN